MNAALSLTADAVEMLLVTSPAHMLCWLEHVNPGYGFAHMQNPLASCRSNPRAQHQILFEQQAYHHLQVAGVAQDTAH